MCSYVGSPSLVAPPPTAGRNFLFLAGRPFLGWHRRRSSFPARPAVTDRFRCPGRTATNTTHNISQTKNSNALFLFVCILQISYLVVCLLFYIVLEYCWAGGSGRAGVVWLCCPPPALPPLLPPGAARLSGQRRAAVGQQLPHLHHRHRSALLQGRQAAGRTCRAGGGASVMVTPCGLEEGGRASGGPAAAATTARHGLSSDSTSRRQYSRYWRSVQLVSTGQCSADYRGPEAGEGGLA